MELKNLIIGERKSDWDTAFEELEKEGYAHAPAPAKNRIVVSRKGGRQF